MRAAAVLVLLLARVSAAAASDVQYWLAARPRLWSSGPREVSARAEQRWADHGRVDHFRLLGAGYRRAARPWLSSGINVSAIQSRRPTFDSPWDSQLRLEVESEPRWSPARWLTARARGRYELRWLDGLGWGHHRLRQRLELSASRGRFFAAAGDEFFFQLEPWIYAENRLVPLSVGWALKRGSLAGYCMLRSLRGPGARSEDLVFGVNLDFR